MEAKYFRWGYCFLDNSVIRCIPHPGTQPREWESEVSKQNHTPESMNTSRYRLLSMLSADRADYLIMLDRITARTTPAELLRKECNRSPIMLNNGWVRA